MGKLDSICDIVEKEHNNLQHNLRLLVLTDYIKRDSVSYIGTEKEFSAISIVSIFEKIRRRVPNVKIAILSGGLCVLASSFKNTIIKDFNIAEAKISTKQINQTQYSIFDFKLNNKEKVKIVGELFNRGDINVLVGTKSLLGEGWDAPCINSLILASFVGSFMLSNQMRGRAIRVNKNQPDKTANIWHLITLEPKPQKVVGINELSAYDVKKSEDYQTLKRRFKCFVGPSLDGKNIESNIERILNVQNVNSEQELNMINKNMLDMATNRDYLFGAWKTQKDGASMFMSTTIPKDRKMKSLAIKNLVCACVMFILLAMGIVGLVQAVGEGIKNAAMCLLLLLSIIMTAAGGYCGITSIFRACFLFSIKGTCKFVAGSILKTMQHMGEINSFAKLKIKKDENESGVVILQSQSIREQTVFQNELSEFFKKINSPRYILTKTNIWGKDDYNYCFQCPSLIAKNKQQVEILKNNLKPYIGSLKMIYAINIKNNIAVFNCKKNAYINDDSMEIETKMTI